MFKSTETVWSHITVHFCNNLETSNSVNDTTVTFAGCKVHFYFTITKSHMPLCANITHFAPAICWVCDAGLTAWGFVWLAASAFCVAAPGAGEVRFTASFVRTWKSKQALLLSLHCLTSNYTKAHPQNHTAFTHKLWKTHNQDDVIVRKQAVTYYTQIISQQNYTMASH
jgi:hypothetical protein